MRMGWIAALLLALPVGVRAGNVEHVRGEYRFSTGDVPAFVVQQDVAAAWPAAAPGADGAPWRVWHYDRQIDRRGERDHAFHDYAYEARSSTLLGEAGKFEVSFSPAFQRLVVHGVDLRRGGRWQSRLQPERITLARRESEFEADTSNGVVSALIVLDDVRPDDVIRLRYSVIGSNPIMAGLLADGGVFAWSHPLLHARLRVLYPPGTRTLQRHGAGLASPRITTKSDATEVVYAADRAAPIASQPDQPTWYRPRPWALSAVERPWKDVVDWALPLYPAATLSPELDALVASWRALPTPERRMQAALRAVQDEVRYFGVQMGDSTHRPAPPSTTWQRRYGDCKDKSYLLATVLQAMGFDAVPALVSNEMGRGVAEEPPAASAFDHVIVQVRLQDGRTLWMDPTRTQAGGAAGAADLSALGRALPVRAQADALVVIDPPAHLVRAMKVDERLVPESQGDAVRMDISTRYEGDLADYARGRMVSEPASERSRRYADYYRKRFGELAVLEEPRVDDDREANVLVVREAYRLQSPWRGTGGARYIDTYGEAMSDRAQVPATPAGRGPVQLGTPSQYEHRTEVRAPAGWSPETATQTRRHDGDAYRYERTIKTTGVQVVVVHRLDVAQRDVTEAEAPRHAAVVREINDSLNARLFFDKPATDQRQQRDARLKALLSGAGAAPSTPAPAPQR